MAKARTYSPTTDNGKTRSKTIRMPVKLLAFLEKEAKSTHDGNLSALVVGLCVEYRTTRQKAQEGQAT